MFTNCSCIVSNSTQTATGGLCPQDCDMLNPYLVINAVGAFLSTLGFMPAFIATIRSVTEEEKPLAIGLTTFISSLLGWFPGPVIYGALVDSTCKIWKMTCSTAGACSLYDIELFRFQYTAISTGLRVIVIVLFAIALLYALCSKKFVFQPYRDIMSHTIIFDKNDNEETIINNKVSLSTENPKYNTSV
ncbi:unnamed protein product [Candidula unifasciata]|uniref:Solute carrier organic anion transporter family member 4A1 n=1 Tax=Candidula unifasciata TaxID=100452 RepID=A0A8S3ZMA8_9EUPU|nr:unnamed protein product [Candidula unifasciata]